jgi:hypothetical protein
MMEYKKYFKMLKCGMPKEVVKHAMVRDEKGERFGDKVHKTPHLFSSFIPSSQTRISWTTTPQSPCPR